jgi:hypothetical protein
LIDEGKDEGVDSRKKEDGTRKQQVFSSAQLDYYVGLGIAADSMMRASLSRPDVEFQLRDGVLSVGRAIPGAVTFSSGARGVELTIDDWKQITARVGNVGFTGLASHRREVRT